MIVAFSIERKVEVCYCIGCVSHKIVTVRREFVTTQSYLPLQRSRPCVTFLTLLLPSHPCRKPVELFQTPLLSTRWCASVTMKRLSLVPVRRSQPTRVNDGKENCNSTAVLTEYGEARELRHRSGETTSSICHEHGCYNEIWVRQREVMRLEKMSHHSSSCYPHISCGRLSTCLWLLCSLRLWLLWWNL